MSGIGIMFVLAAAFVLLAKRFGYDHWFTEDNDEDQQPPKDGQS